MKPLENKVFGQFSGEWKLVICSDLLSITKKNWRRSLKTMGKITTTEWLNIRFTSSYKQRVHSRPPINPTRVEGGPFQTFIPNEDYNIIIYFHDFTN